MDDQNLTSCRQVPESVSLKLPQKAVDEVRFTPAVTNRGELARRLLGAGRRFSPERDAVAELIAERVEDE